MTHHHGLATIAKIKEGHGKNLRQVLAGLDKAEAKTWMNSLTTVHFASWVILSGPSLQPARLLLETNYDGELDAHLNDLLKYGSDALDDIYAHCEGYPASGAKHSLTEVKQFLSNGAIPSSAFYVAFPGTSLTDLRNAIKVYEEAQKFINDDLRRPYSYVDPDGHQQTVPSGFDELPPSVVQDALVHYFRSSKAQNRPDRLVHLSWLRLMLNWLLAVARVAEGVPLAVLAWFCERAEARRPRDHDPTEHSVDDALYQALDRRPHNHLCTFKTVKPGRLRLFILTRILSIVSFFSRTIFIFSRLGELSTIHFAKWMLIDDKQRGSEPSASDYRLLFVSNYDGSFGNYLGDFSDLAWYGLNPIWSNTVGFPPTRALFGAGAKDIKSFEETDRAHFYPAQVFYSAYDGYAVQNIRRYLDFSDKLARDIAAAAKKERRRWRMVERLERRSKCTVERHDLQGIVTSGFLHCRHARYLFLEICDTATTRVWLDGIVDHISTAERREPFQAKPQTHLNIAFTHEGLKKLGLPEETLKQFPYEFSAGMTRPEAALMLGDTGFSSPKNWQFGDVREGEANPLHMMVLLFATSEAELNAWENFVLGEPAFAPFRILHRIDSVTGEDRNEPFGFRDGIAQPHVLSLMKTPPARASDVVNPGEFVLGYRNEHDKQSYAASIVKSLDGGKYFDLRKYLPAHPDNPKLSSFGVNGTFLVARKLSQKVDEFWQFAARESVRFDGSSDPERRELLAARLMGRWRSGAPLLLSADRDIPILGRLSFNNDFRYSKADPDGEACPVGAHIRRANPRDDVKLGKQVMLMRLYRRRQSQRLSQRHRIIRRGRRYRELAEGSTSYCSQYNEGVLFIALNADLHRQFEFMQQTWLNSPTFQGLDNDKDAVVGDNDGTGGFTVQNGSGNQRASGLPRFVTVKGGGYFFLPGINAVRFLANMKMTPSAAKASTAKTISSHAS